MPTNTNNYTGPGETIINKNQHSAKKLAGHIQKLHILTHKNVTLNFQ